MNSSISNRQLDEFAGDDSAANGRSVQNVAILGATGSIGTAAVDVIKHLNSIDPQHRWHVWAASGHRNLDCLAEIASSFETPPDRLILSAAQASAAGTSTSKSPITGDSATSQKRFAGFSGQIETGPDALVRAASAPEVDTVVASIVGRAGLESTIAAIQHGKRVALANKETLVVAGPLVRREMAVSGADLLPVDSEHSAIFQCIGAEKHNVKRLILTASGGPFRTATLPQMRAATRADALAHPTWQMGPKITIDSATMMNKALEVIEARWLFDLPAEKIDVVVHPQSVVHSMVEFVDGSVIAQLSPPDMRLPIQYALTYPRRLPSQCQSLDISSPCDLGLEPADRERFPALDLGFEVAASGGTAGAVVNGANEEAVGLFLDDKIRFTDIVPACRKVLESHDFEPEPSLSRLTELDRWSRQELRRVCESP